MAEVVRDFMGNMVRSGKKMLELITLIIIATYTIFYVV